MIPKIIHYCWFGRNPLPQKAVDCIASWKKYLPEYEIIEWNEDNFPIENYRYAKEALNHKKYAFVSDVSRLFALKHYGGIYMDTDVEVLKPLDNFLSHAAFSGYESNNTVPTGLMASEKEGKWVNDLISYYDGKSFLKADGTFNLIPNTVIITNMMFDRGLILNNEFYDEVGYVSFYPKDFFCPKNWDTLKLELTKNTHCIHHFDGSWKSDQEKKNKRVRERFIKLFGHILGDKFAYYYITIISKT